MKLLIILILISSICFGQNTIDRTITEVERVNLKKVAFDFQNRGQMYDEREHNFKKASELVDSAILIFESIKDTLNLANNLKLYGYLKARQGDFSNAKNIVERSIRLFNCKKAFWGVAVSNFDMARIFYLEKISDSAIYYCNSAIKYWQNKNDTDRIFINRNLLIGIYVQSKEFKSAKELQRLNHVTSSLKPQHWQNLLDFYCISYILSTKTKDKKSAKRYRMKAESLRFELGKEEIKAISFFD